MSEETLNYLYGLTKFGIKPGLEQIKKIMSCLGNPEKNLKTIHVAGTNGKGSVCAMISSILQKAGYKVGMYTSPHLIDFRERILINDKKIPEKDVERLVSMIKSHKISLTFFEFTTAMALQYFKEQKVDYAVIEVGLGGRLDATNIIDPVASVITNVSFDHTEILGNTLREISAEKAGIIKNAPVFTSEKNSVISDVCKKNRTKLIIVKGNMETNMKGSFQKKNAALATAVAGYIGISEDHIKDGLLCVGWPGRLDFVEENVLVDCAHNPAGIKEVSKFVKKINYEKLIIIFGVMKDKNYDEMLNDLPECDLLILTKPKIKRALDPSLIDKKGKVIEDVGEAYKYAKKIATEKDLIFICGSCYLIGEFLAFKNKIKTTPLTFV